MSEILNDWHRYCKGEADFDKSHFLTLFHEIDETACAEAMSYFDHAHDISARIADVRRCYPNPAHPFVADRGRCLELAAQDLAQKRIVFEAEGDDEMVGVINTAPLEFVEDAAVFEAAIDDEFNLDLHAGVTDYCNDRREGGDLKYALFEALFGLANSYDIQRYAAQSLINVTINLDVPFALWKIGGAYALTEDRVLVTQAPLNA